MGYAGRQKRSGSPLRVKPLCQHTCRSDVKGESQAVNLWSERVPMRSTGADQLVVAMKFLYGKGAKVLTCPK